MRGLGGALLAVALAVGCSRSDAPAAGVASASAGPVASAPVAPATASEAPSARPVTSAVAAPERRSLPAHRLEVPGGARLLLLVDEHHWHVVDERSSEWGTWVRDGAILRPPGPQARPLVALAGSPESGAIELRIDDEAPRSIKVSARMAPRPVPEPVTPRPKEGRLGTAALRPRAAPEVPGCIVSGWVPDPEPAIPTTAATFESALRTLCRAAEAGARLAVDYDAVVLGGTTVSGADESTTSPPSRTVLAVDLRIRTTGATSSVVSEAAFLMDFANRVVVPLASLHTDSGRASMEKRAAADGGTLALGSRQALGELIADATESIGPSTIDLVVPTLPLGLFLARRRIQLGPRSELVGSYAGDARALPAEARRSVKAPAGRQSSWRGPRASRTSTPRARALGAPAGWGAREGARRTGFRTGRPLA